MFITSAIGSRWTLFGLKVEFEAFFLLYVVFDFSWSSKLFEIELLGGYLRGSAYFIVEPRQV